MSRPSRRLNGSSKRPSSLDNRKKIASFVKTFTRRNGYPPSIRQIGLELGGWSPSTVHYYLDLMESEGLIRREPGIARSIRVK